MEAGPCKLTGIEEGKEREGKEGKGREGEGEEVG